VPTGRRRELLFASHLAPCILPTYEFITRRLGEELGCPAKLIPAGPLEQLVTGEVDFAFLCGLPYVRLRREQSSAVEAVAAPVVRGERYGGRPIYFSDVVVSRASPADTFEDLRGCSWAYNEPDSHSGYLVTLFRLCQMGESTAFFGSWVMTGFHQESLRRVAYGQVDASAIDSQVLSVELRDHPELAERVRIIDALGPSTIQPLVATRAVPDSLRREVADIVTRLALAEADRASLAQGLVERLVSVDDACYDDIRGMLEAVESAGLTVP
jgi:phosphonate transport system substrate-binding protein